MLLCPWINLSPESYTQKPESYIRPEVFLKHQHDNLGLRFAQAYLGNLSDAFDPLVSPVYADLSGNKKTPLNNQQQTTTQQTTNNIKQTTKADN